MVPGAGYIVRERDGSGRVIAQYESAHEQASKGEKPRHARSFDWRGVLSNIFLPEGYPATVSDDYLQYQIWNALQAFCSSLASLFASRAVLQAHGVGNASASATNAILLTVIQDIFSRLTTIASGYYLGTSLYPEAKTYRLLADIFNDAALVTDTLSPYLATIALSPRPPYVVPAADSPLRIVALCLSGASRALCGAVAGGSKAALAVHFASAGARPGDVGDLSAKDGSKETVLALLGMLCGSVVVHYVHGARETYAVLFALIACHLAANTMAVRVISMRFFNRQRASIAWGVYRKSVRCTVAQGNPEAEAEPTVLPHNIVSRREEIFTDPSWIGAEPTRCTLGVPFAALIGPCETHDRLLPSMFNPFSLLTPHARLREKALNDRETSAVLALFANEQYVLWYASASAAPLRLRVALKAGHGPVAHLKAWAHAHELARECGGRTPRGFDEQLQMARAALEGVSRMLPGFVDGARAAGWKIEEGALVGGSPVTMEVELVGTAGPGEDRKNV